MVARKTMAFHPASELFPLLEGERRKELLDSIKSLGLLNPIWTYQGDILDGRNRYQICQEIGVEPVFQEYQGETPYAFVLAQNLQRRDLSVVQRIRIAESARKEIEREARSRQRSGTLSSNDDKVGRTSEKIGEMAGVSQATAERYHQITVNGTPQLKAAVDAEEVSIGDAASIVHEPAAVQKKAVNQKKSGKANTVKAAVEKIKQASEPAAESPKDKLGLEIPHEMRDAFFAAAKFAEIRNHFKQAAKLINELAELPGGEKYKSELSLQGNQEKASWKCAFLQDALGKLNYSEPYAAACPWCHAKHPGKLDRQCGSCGGRGWVVKKDWDQAPDDYKRELTKVPF